MPHSALARLSLLLVATSALCPVAALAADPTTITKLAPITAAFGISADGQTVVGYYSGNGHPKGIIWKSGEIPAEPLSNMDDNFFTGISGDGSAVTGYFSAGGINSPFVYTIGTPTDLPVYATTGVGTIAQGINADGSVVVGTGPNASSSERGIVWSGPNWQTKTTIEPIDPAGATDAYAVGGPLAHPIVVGEDIDHNNTFDAYWWQDGTTHDLTRTGYLGANAYAISRDGSTIVGDVLSSSTHGDAAIWSGAGYSTLTDIGTLGGRIAYAKAVDADGRVVVGDSFITGDAGVHVFRYADGHMDDLNDLISGVNPDSVVLEATAGISDDGRYIAANAISGTKGAYLVYYDDGHVGLTDSGDQQGSVDALGQERQAVATAADPYFSLLQGDLDRHDQSSSAGAFGLFGSAVAGLRGHWWLGNGFTLTGGIADGTTEAGDANIGNALFGAAALRYDADDFAVGAFHPFVQVGLGEALLSGVSFTRDYGSGSGTGMTGGALSTAYLRAGLSADFDSGDQLAFAGEIGESWLSINGYDEPFSNSNMFPANIADGSDQSTVGKLSATWSHQITDKVDLTLQAALAADLTGRSGLKIASTGFGTLQTAYVPAMWAEGGAHLTWNVSPNSNIDLYADGTAGGPGGTHAHIGVGFHITN